MEEIKKIVLNDEPQENGNDVKEEGGLRLPPTGSGSGSGGYIGDEQVSGGLPANYNTELSIENFFWNVCLNIHWHATARVSLINRILPNGNMVTDKILDPSSITLESATYQVTLSYTYSQVDSCGHIIGTVTETCVISSPDQNHAAPYGTVFYEIYNARFIGKKTVEIGSGLYQVVQQEFEKTIRVSFRIDYDSLRPSGENLYIVNPAISFVN